MSLLKNRISGLVMASIPALAVTLLGAGSASAFEACQPESPQVASRDAGGKTTISISADKNVGKFVKFVVVYWINHQGKFQEFTTLEPGQQFNQDTYAGHMWVAKDGTGQCQYFTVQSGTWNFFHIKYDDGP